MTDAIQASWRTRRMLQAAGLAAAGVALDQVSKAIAAGALANGAAHIGPLHLRLVANRGIIMGMVGVPIWTITFAAGAIVVLAARSVWTGTTVQSTIGYALLTAGAVGNLTDRFLQRPDFPPNAVVDWLSFGGSTFNVADVLLVAAALLLLSGRSNRPATPHPSPPPNRPQATIRPIAPLRSGPPDRPTDSLRLQVPAPGHQRSLSLAAPRPGRHPLVTGDSDA